MAVAMPRRENLESLSALLVRARWIAAAAVPAVVALAWAALSPGTPEPPVNVWGMADVAGLLVLANLLVIIYSRRRLGAGVDPAVIRIRLDMMVRIQVGVDVVALAMAFNYMGGIESPVAFASVFQAVAVARWLGPREGRIAALAMLTGVCLVAMLEYNDAVHHWHLMSDWRWGVWDEPRYIVSYLGSLAALLALSVWAGAGGRRIAP